MAAGVDWQCDNSDLSCNDALYTIHNLCAGWWRNLGYVATPMKTSVGKACRHH
jgi:hypothetical protein